MSSGDILALGFTAFAIAVAFILGMIFSYSSGWNDGKEDGKRELDRALYEDGWNNGWKDCAHRYNLSQEIPAPGEWSTEALDAHGKAWKAIAYVLEQIRDRPQLAWYVGSGKAFELLTEAFAAYARKPVEEIRASFTCPNSLNPEEISGERLDQITSAHRAHVRADLRKPILEILELFPFHRGLQWATTTEEQLLEIIRKRVELDRPKKTKVA